MEIGRWVEKERESTREEGVKETDRKKQSEIILPSVHFFFLIFFVLPTKIKQFDFALLKTLIMLVMLTDICTFTLLHTVSVISRTARKCLVNN